SDIRRSPPPQHDSPNTGCRPALPAIAELTKPNKKAGYGFSFSDDTFYDSDEYPDTECEWTLEEPEPVKESESTKKQAQTPSSKQLPSTIIRQDTSFTDVVVMRDVGSFHIARPQKRLSCTTATREDTIRIKHAAKMLLKHAESAEVCEQLLAHLERMVCAALQKPERWGHHIGATTTCCALKLRDLLVNSKQERVVTGELQNAVEHEMEWAKWLVEASCTGVMHLKVPGCDCRPDWEE
ncbi:hypothetical protein EK21DRAFT_25267, partial [Setomelanomma holmii]